jgi:YggT family protein
MGGGYLSNPLVFLVDTITWLYIVAIMLRFLLQCVRADFYNPYSQFLVKITNPPLKPLRRIIPGWGGIDVAALVLMLLVQILAIALILLINGVAVQVPALLIVAVVKLVVLLIHMYMFTIIVQALLSWIQPGAYNPLTGLLYSLNEPLLRPARRLIPPISGIDLSPIAVLIALQVLKMLLVPLFRGLM